MEAATNNPTNAPHPLSRVFQIAAGYVIAVACLIWIFHDVPLSGLAENIKGIRWGWVLPAIAFDVLSYATQAVRWRLLLRPLGDISPIRATQAVYAGLFTSEVLPMRAGEIVRAYLASKWMSLRTGSVIPSLAVERFFDGVWLSLYIGIVAVFVPLPRNIFHAAEIFGVVIITGTVVLVTLILRPHGRPAAATADTRGPASTPARATQRMLLPFQRLGRWLVHFGAVVRLMGRTPAFYLSFGISSLILVFQAIAFWLVMVAYGFHFPIWTGAVVFLIQYFGTAIPNAPGNVGSYQFFVIIGLALFGVDKTRATGFSVIVFVLLTMPLWLIGSLALRRSGVTIGQVRRDAAQWMGRG